MPCTAGSSRSTRSRQRNPSPPRPTSHATANGLTAEDYLRVSDLFRLGRLTTEQPHPLTRDLSAWARDDLPRAIAALEAVDRAALARLARRAAALDELAGGIRDTLASGSRVFLCGCGATGRLSLTLEALWRQAHPGDERVRSFMAGGDIALVHALEGFEDRPELGRRHLLELGFADGDLLIASTEGGETPFVIGATEAAAERSRRNPWFLFCNPEAQLTREVERFRRVRANPAIRRLCLGVGPMALSGSTRMQASTVLQLGIGLALLHLAEGPAGGAPAWIARYRRLADATDLSFLAPFIETEAAAYAAGDRVTYRVRDYGITVFTDTTERAPTFSLAPFERHGEDRSRHSLCTIALDDARDPPQAWLRLLRRRPRALDWPEVDARTGRGYLEEFDFSAAAVARRRRALPASRHEEFLIRSSGVNGSADGIVLRLGRLAHLLPTPGEPILFRHLLLKQALNAHSTLVMGRLGRYEGNVMTWVRPSNGKLVDRAVRYVGLLMERDRSGGRPPTYEAIARCLFRQIAAMPPDEPAVLRTLQALRIGGEASSPAPAPRPGAR